MIARRRKHRGHHRPGLFDFAADGNAAATEPHINPLLVSCPACAAGFGQPCTTAGRTRRTVHPSRRDAAGDHPQETDR